MPALQQIDLSSADAVCETLAAGASACRNASCRIGSIEHVHHTHEGTDHLIATGDLHDNPRHLEAVLDIAGFDGEPGGLPHHLTLHELIHGENLIDGMDPSYRMLVRAAALKAAYPERVHVLLANHELSQIAGRGVIKNGVNCVKAFNDAVNYVFTDRADRVHDALAGFIRALPIALRCTPVQGPDVLCAHSLPGDSDLEAFDTTILQRDLTEADYQPRSGSAHLMTWGRSQSPQTLERLSGQWNVGLFIVGHEKAAHGVANLPPCGLILNTDHDHPAVCRLNLSEPCGMQQAHAGITLL